MTPPTAREELGRMPDLDVAVPDAVPDADVTIDPVDAVRDRSGIRGLLLFAAIAVVLVLLATLTPLREAFSTDAIQRLADRLGLWGPAAILLIGIVSPLAFAPRWPIAYVSGLLYGLFWGVLLSTVASTLGAWLHFALASNLLGPAAGRMRGRIRVTSVRTMPNRRVFIVLFLIRALPISNFVATNLLAGAMNVRTGVYVAATFLGMIPSSILYAVGGRMTLDPSRTHLFTLFSLLVLMVLGAWFGRRYWLPHLQSMRSR